jgi:glycosyltransferase 2 family protein
VKQVLKGAVAVSLIGVLLWMVDWREAFTILGRLSWWVLSSVLVVMAIEFALSAAKWSVALRMHGLSFSLTYLYRIICVAFFLNNFLPTAIGGDAYRVYRTLPADDFRSRAVFAVLVERGTGLAALLTIGAVAALMMVGERPIAGGYLLFYLLGLGAGLALLGALWHGGLASRFGHLKVVDAVLHSMDRLKRVPRWWALQVSLSVAFQSLSIGLVWWLFLQTGHPLSYWTCALITAAGGLAMFLPISLNGIGVMEGSFVAMAVALGVGYDQALTVAILRRVMMAALSLLCGLVYLAEGRPDGTVPETA